jgi:Signal transduction histidine kinase
MNKFNHFFSSCSQPSETVIPNECERRLLQRKARTSILIFSFLSLFPLIFKMFSSCINPSYLSILFPLTDLAILLTTCKVKPYLYKRLCLLLALLYIPVSRILDNDQSETWATVLVLPAFGHFLSDGDIAFLFLPMAQVLYYCSELVGNSFFSIDTHWSSEQSKQFSSSIFYASIINMVLLAASCSRINFYRRQLIRSETQRIEAESHKIHHLSSSHEIRNLVSNIIGSIQTPLSEMALPESIKKYLKNAKLCGKILLNLLNNALDIEKADAGELEVNLSSVNISECLKEIWSVCCVMIEKKGLQGTLYIAQSIPKALRMDTYRLAQVLFNLVSNAIKFTDKGQINIVVEWIEGKSKVDDACFEPYPFDEDGVFEKSQSILRLSQEYSFINSKEKAYSENSTEDAVSGSDTGILKISVNDTGAGMDKLQVEKLFQKFAQVSDEASKRQIGTGLGLYITKQICEKLNGQIRAFSKKGQGTAFVLCLPARIENLSGSFLNSPNMNKNYEHLKLKLLLAGTSQFSLLIVSNYLKKVNIEIAGANSTLKEIFDKYKSQSEAGQQPDLIILDNNNSYTEIQSNINRIRKFEKDKNLKPSLIIITSDSNNKDQNNHTIPSIRENPVVYVKRPLRREDLEEAIIKHFRN